MLTHIHIQNFAIVESLSLDFQNGLQVLTGETGAGKSIWVDALQIGLGERADASVIFAGANCCNITLCFDLHNLDKAAAWLTAQDIDTTDGCIIRRVIHRSKPSRTTVNGIPMPQSLVRELSHLLLCIHSQHQHQRLLKPTQQRNLLDQYAHNSNLLQTIKSHYAQWESIHKKLQTLQAQAQSKAANLSLWQYQLEEIQALSLSPNEFETRFQHFQQLQQSKNIIGSLNEAATLLADEHQPAALTLLAQAQHYLQSIHTDDPALVEAKEIVASACIQVEEASSILAKYCRNADIELAQVDEIEQRLNQIQDIARKHHVEPEQLLEIEAQLTQQIDTLNNIEAEITALEKQRAAIEHSYQETAKKLTAQRNQFAKSMAQAITDQMQILAMKGGQCQIVNTPLPQGVHPFGNETITFEVATNPGQAPQPLSQHVSGGELSRLSLISHVLTAEANDTQTLIFDEVDVGIGGKTADVVGRLLRQLGEKTQVLCITHLPQVAANGHVHYRAEKTTHNQGATTTIKALSQIERTEELARMLSGSNITEKSLSHANELLAFSDQ